MDIRTVVSMTAAKNACLHIVIAIRAILSARVFPDRKLRRERHDAAVGDNQWLIMAEIRSERRVLPSGSALNLIGAGLKRQLHSCLAG